MSNNSQVPPTSATVISGANLKSLIDAAVRSAVANLAPAPGTSESRPLASPAPSGDVTGDRSDAGVLGPFLSPKGPSFQKSGYQEQYGALASILKSIEDAIVVLERGLDPQVALHSVKTAKLLLEKRMSQVILADRVGSWSVVEKVCDDTASYVTDPAAKKALETFNSLQGRQLFRGVGANKGPNQRRSFDRSTDQARSSRRSRSRSPQRRSPRRSRSPRRQVVASRSLPSTSYQRPANDDYCYKCGGFGHWANNCPTASSSARGSSQFTGRSGFANGRR